jgi:hypothetical protein
MSIRIDRVAILADVTRCRNYLIALEPLYQVVEHTRYVSLLSNAQVYLPPLVSGSTSTISLHTMTIMQHLAIFLVLPSGLLTHYLTHNWMLCPERP